MKKLSLSFVLAFAVALLALPLLSACPDSDGGSSDASE